MRACVPGIAVSVLAASWVPLGAEAQSKEGDIARRDCPDFLRARKTDFLPSSVSSLCDLFKRFQAAKVVLRDRNADAGRLADARAPRFINLPDWTEKRERARYSPWAIYRVQGHENEPFETWRAWERCAEFVKKQAESNLRNKRFLPLDKPWLLSVHSMCMEGLMDEPGIPRRLPLVGESVEARKAPTEAQIKGLMSLPYETSDEPKEKLLRWHPTQCVEQLPALAQKRFKRARRMFESRSFPAVAPDRFFRDERGRNRQCGYYDYPGATELNSLLREWARDLNADVLRLYDEVGGDLLLIAARAEQRLVAIHPFSQGNGRVSRLVADLIFMSLGLEPPILEDMDQDLYLSPEAWARTMGEGLIRTLGVYERCARDLRAPGCQIVGARP